LVSLLCFYNTPAPQGCQYVHKFSALLIIFVHYVDIPERRSGGYSFPKTALPPPPDRNCQRPCGCGDLPWPCVGAASGDFEDHINHTRLSPFQLKTTFDSPDRGRSKTPPAIFQKTDTACGLAMENFRFL
jgi:hypothetical protein